MSNVEYKQSTVEKKSPQENISQGENLEKRIIEEQKAEKWVNVSLYQLEGKQVETETIQKADQLKNEIDKSKYEKLPLQTYNEVVKWTELEQRMLKVLAHPDFENYPEMKGKLMTFMILFIALDESVAIYGLIVAFKILAIDPTAMTNPYMYIAAGLAIGLPGLAVGIGEGYLAKVSVDNMGKNPELSSTFMVLTILGLALVESAAIYGLIVAFRLIG